MRNNLSLGDYIFTGIIIIFLALIITIMFSIEETSAIVIYDNNKAIWCKRINNYVGDTAECIVSFGSRTSSRKTFLLDNINEVYYKKKNNQEYEYLKSILGYYTNKSIPKKLLDNINLLK